MRASRLVARVAAALALSTGFRLAHAANPSDPSERPARKGTYRYIDPLLDCRQEEDRKEVRSFKKHLDALVKDAEVSGKANMAAVYFRDLSNGAWLGIEEKEVFLPASLLKVPLMMAVYREAEDAPGLLSERLPIADEGQLGLAMRFSSATALVAGSTATVGDLVSVMVRRSDNAALLTLVRRFGGAGIQAIYDDLGVAVSDDGVPEALRVKDYASLFRLLYNASYLGRRLSEKALQELAHTEFRSGITAPLPAAVEVAHKYGERGLDSGEKQLHDCGIVYYPGRPYILCVMTRGSDWEALSGVIRSVSKLVYREVSAQFPVK